MKYGFSSEDLVPGESSDAGFGATVGFKKKTDSVPWRLHKQLSQWLHLLLQSWFFFFGRACAFWEACGANKHRGFSHCPICQTRGRPFHWARATASFKVFASSSRMWSMAWLVGLPVMDLDRWVCLSLTPLLQMMRVLTNHAQQPKQVGTSTALTVHCTHCKWLQRHLEEINCHHNDSVITLDYMTPPKLPLKHYVYSRKTNHANQQLTKLIKLL